MKPAMGSNAQNQRIADIQNQDIRILQDALSDYLGDGLHSITVSIKSIPTVRDWQLKIPPPAVMYRHIETGKAVRIGLVCSDGLECIDIDVKNDPNSDIHKRYFARCMDHEGGTEILRKVIVQKTKSQGIHLIYRRRVGSEEYEGSKKLACRNIIKDGKPARSTLIETKGKGGYFVAAPSIGYKVLRGSLRNIPTITEEERDFLLDMARSLDEKPPAPKIEERKSTAPRPTYTGGQPDIFDAFNRHVSPLEVLKRNGWKVTHQDDYRTYVKRPGGSTKEKTSGNIKLHEGYLLFKCWSRNAGLPTEGALNSSQLLALMEFNGDWGAARRYLKDEGYGIKEGMR